MDPCSEGPCSPAQNCFAFLSIACSLPGPSIPGTCACQDLALIRVSKYAEAVTRGGAWLMPFAEGLCLGLILSPGELVLFRRISATRGRWDASSTGWLSLLVRLFRGSLALSWIPGEGHVVGPGMQVYGRVCCSLCDNNLCPSHTSVLPQTDGPFPKRNLYQMKATSCKDQKFISLAR